MARWAMAAVVAFAGTCEVTEVDDPDFRRKRGDPESAGS